jgi:hypothetical protein
MLKAKGTKVHVEDGIEIYLNRASFLPAQWPRSPAEVRPTCLRAA